MKLIAVAAVAAVSFFGGCQKDTLLVRVECLPGAELSVEISEPIETRCCSGSNGVKDCAIYSQGELLRRETIVDGTRDGAFEQFHRNGMTAVKGRYCREKQCGQWISFDSSGAVKEMHDNGTASQ